MANRPTADDINALLMLMMNKPNSGASAMDSNCTDITTSVDKQTGIVAGGGFIGIVQRATQGAHLSGWQGAVEERDRKIFGEFSCEPISGILSSLLALNLGNAEAALKRL